MAKSKPIPERYLKRSKPCRKCGKPTWGPFRGPTASTSEERCTNGCCPTCCAKHCRHVSRDPCMP